MCVENVVLGLLLFKSGDQRLQMYTWTKSVVWGTPYVPCGRGGAGRERLLHVLHVVSEATLWSRFTYMYML